MTYSRKYSRRAKYDIRKERKSGSKSIQVGILSALATFSSFLGGIAYAEGEVNVTRAGGVTVSSDTNANGVANLYAEKVDTTKNLGINRFESFDVKTNETVNLHFQNSSGSDAIKVNKLVNLVKGDMNVAGAVNAIKEGKIGGDLYFLSSGGITVTKGGVINAGSLTMITTKGDYLDEDLAESLGKAKIDVNKRSIFTVGNLEGEIPLNPTGTITVAGKIRTTNDVTLIAGRSITIGTKNEKAEFDVVATTGPQATEGTDNAIIKTGITDFSKLVNLTEAQLQAIGASAVALQSNQTTGTIDLIATSDTRNFKGESQGLAPVDAVNKSNQIKTEIIQYGNLEATGNVSLKAQSVGVGERAVGVISDVEVYGKTKANQVDVSAKSVLNMVDSGDADRQFKEAELGGATANYWTNFGMGVLDTLVGVVGINSSPDYSLSGTRATVNMAEGSVIKATGDVNINAETDAMVVLGTKSSPYILWNNNSILQAIPQVPVTFVRSKNYATVTIAGAVESNKNVNIDALATAKIAASSINKPSGGKGQLAVFALSFLNGENNAEVDITEKGSVTSTSTGTHTVYNEEKKKNEEVKDGVFITAKTFTGNQNEAGVSTSDKGLAAVAITLTQYNSNAKINIAGKVDSKQVLNANAVNTITNNTIKTNNNLGADEDTVEKDQSKQDSNLYQSLFSTAVGQHSVIETALDKIMAKYDGKWGGNLANKVKGWVFDDPNQPPAEPSFITQLGEKLKFGTAVQYVEQDNLAKVNIAKTALLKSGDDMSIKANSVVDDTHMNVSSGINLFSQTANNNKASAAISVMVTNVTNNSEVTVEGADTKPSSGTEQTYGMIVGKKLTVEAQTDADYKRVKHMVSEALDAVAKLKEELNKMGESTAVADLKGKLATLSDKFTALNNDIPETVTDESGNTVNGNLARITELDKRFLSLKDSLTGAVDSMKQI